MKVLMRPYSVESGKSESGIRRVCEAYERYLPEYGVEFINPKSDDSFTIFKKYRVQRGI